MHTDSLVNEYVHVVNQAIGQHRDEFPYKQLLEVGDRLLDDQDLRMDVYKDDADSPHDHFMLGFAGGKLSLKSQGKQDADITWSVPRSHIEAVVDDPSTYVEHPEKLDLDWVKRRFDA